MKVLTYIIILAALVSCSMDSEEYKLLVSGYTLGTEMGFAELMLKDDGRFVEINKYYNVGANPSFFALSEDAKSLYFVNELDSFAGQHSGGMIILGLDEQVGEWVIKSSIPVDGTIPCHINLIGEERFTINTNYGDGSVSVVDIDDIENPKQCFYFITNDTSRQSRMHSSIVGKDGKSVYIADLGKDRIWYFVLTDNGELTQFDNGFLQMDSLDGPRHMEFSKDGNYLYVLNELSSSVATCRVNADKGLSVVDKISTLPPDYNGENACADIHISGDGRFLYVSNRGHNSITVFGVNQDDGGLTFLKTISVEGNWPRNFVLSSDGSLLIVANQRSKSLSVFRRDAASGDISFISKKEFEFSPSCVKFDDN
ncbi:MAG: lactonase family protein [Bacteroidales bacterium]